jgi:hypothetical protein
MRQATKDEIVTQIHVLWERGWKVNPSSVKEMLEKGPRTSSLNVIEKVIAEYCSSEKKKEHLSYRKGGKPWGIDKSYSFQEQE